MTINWKLAPRASARTLTLSATALVAAGLWMAPDAAHSQGAPKKGTKDTTPTLNNADNIAETTLLRIPANSQFPVTRRVSIGFGRALMVQFPMELRDVMVSDPGKVDIILQTSDRVFLVAKSPGAGSAFFFDTQGNQVATLEITIGNDLGELDALFKRLIPGSSIKTDLAGSAIVLTGSVRTPADSQRAQEMAKQFAAVNRDNLATGVLGAQKPVTDSQKLLRSVINMLSVDGEDQVMLKVVVAEMNRSVLKQFGVNMSASLGIGNFSTGFSTANSLPLTSQTLGALGSTGLLQPAPWGKDCFAVQPQIGTGTTPGPNGQPISGPILGNSGPWGGFSGGSSCLMHTVRALERHGLVRTLAEPTLTAVSGETARFLAGGEYPIPVSFVNGSLGLEFKEYGVSLAFTPVVLSEGRISLKVDTQVSELSNDGALVLSGTQIPSLRKRSALSTVELPSGGSMTMAGLISDQTRQNVDGFPGLKDVPVLGTLFRSKDFIQSETELVVIVTPYMVRATARQNLARPDDGFAPASDLKGNILGHLNRVYGKGKPAPEGDLKGSHGFIVD